MDKVIEFSLFILFTLALVVISWRALRRPGSHGFYRFFAWECILGLVLFNARIWFSDPFSWHQVLSWILLILSLFLVLSGVKLLLELGAQNAQRADSDSFGFEKTTQLVTNGLYAYIRHPLYSSLLFLAWGAFLKQPSWIGLLLALGSTGFLYATARVEETENKRTFGPAYEAYMKRSKMFFPYIL